jgi:lipoprotein-anchoring transpeptidase ErfK/SrfK
MAFIISSLIVGALFVLSHTALANQNSIKAFNQIHSNSVLPAASKIVLARNTFVFSPREKRWYAYDSKGRLVKSGRASGGRSYCPDIKRSCRTPSGVYYVRSKGGPGCRSSRYPVGRGGAPMPYCMFYSKHYAIHGSPNVPRYNASHGCIRVLPSAARWLSRNFIRIGTKVVVKKY